MPSFHSAWAREPDPITVRSFPPVYRSQPAALGRDPGKVFLGDDSLWTCLDRLVSSILGGTSLIALTGEAGSGKSTILEAALARLAERPIRFIWVASASLRSFSASCVASKLPVSEILERLAHDLNGRHSQVLPVAAKEYTQICLIIDNAETLGPEALFFLLLSIEAATTKEIVPSILFVGRPDFWTLFEHPLLARLRKRSSTHLQLSPLSDEGGSRYVEHLLQRAGASVQNVMSQASLRALVRFARANPRRINSLLAAALELADGAGKKITPRLIAQAAAALDGRGAQSTRTPPVGYVERLVTLARSHLSLSRSEADGATTAAGTAFQLPSHF